MTSLPIRSPVRILGIDPGLRRTGWGVIDIDGNRLIYVGCGSVESREASPLAERLLAIHEGLARVLGDFKPAEAAVEPLIATPERSFQPNPQPTRAASLH